MALISSSVNPPDTSSLAEIELNLFSSSANTLSVPSSDTSNVTRITRVPLGSRGILFNTTLPKNLFSLANKRSP